MNESFLHYLWQFQYFDRKELKTTAGENLVVFKPGILNTDAGPDFAQAKIEIDGIGWAGSVEVHIHSSGWMNHGHHQDGAYESVVLHVVWEEDKPVYRADGSRIPTLELKKRADAKLIEKYTRLVNTSVLIPCEKSFHTISDLVKHAMVDKALMKRLEAKADQVTRSLQQNKGDWEETTFQLLASNFGFKVNKEPFLQLAKALPYRLIQKHRDQPLQIEALIFGQAGFLVARTKDEYVSALFTEYQFLSRKYSLDATQLNPSQWKFLRLRPANFPSLRLAQFASLLQSRKSVFSALIEMESYKDLQRFFEINTSDYWQTHYRFGKKAKGAVPAFGEASADIVIINSVVPLLVAYGKAKDDWTMVDRAVDMLQNITSEKNRIVSLWKDIGYISKNAFDSQGLIELYQGYCQNRQCLNCTIGSAILKPAASAS